MTRLLLDREACVALVQALLWSCLQAALLYAAAMLVCTAIGPARAIARYYVLVVALALIVVCVPVTAAWQVQQSRLAASREWSELINSKVRPPAPAAASNAGRASPPPAPAASDDRAGGPAADAFVLGRRDSWGRAAPWALFAYVLGVGAMLTGVVRAVRGGQRLASQSTPLSDTRVMTALARASEAMGFGYTPAVAACKALTVPAVVGVLRPVVLVPIALATEMHPEQIKLVVMHELAHIRRHDQVIDLLQRIIESFLFFNPFVWLLSNQIRAERECCCDDLVIRAGGRRDAYAESLLRAGEIELQGRRRTGIAAAALAATGPRSEIRQRILRLVLPAESPRLRLTRWPAIGVGLVSCFAALAPLLLVVNFLPASLTPTADELALDSLSSEVRAAESNQPARRLKDWSLLHRAVVFGTDEEVRMLLRKNADPNILAPKGWAPLHFAASLGRTSVATMLIRASADVNASSDDGHTPLHAALGGASPLAPSSTAPREPMVRLLLNERADPNLADRRGMQPIHIATSFGSVAMVRDLAAGGAAIDAPGATGLTSLHIACNRRDEPMINELLNAGAKCDGLNTAGESVLDCLAMSFQPLATDKPGPVPIAVALRDGGSSMSLTAAVALGFNANVEAALDANPGLVNAKPVPTRLGFSLLHWAAYSGNAQMVTFLLSRGADVHAVSGDSRTPLHVALGRELPNADAIDALIVAGADVNAVGRRGQRPLHLAAMLRAAQPASLLLSKNADPTAPDDSGATPLDYLVIEPPLPAAEVAVAEAFIARRVDLNHPGLNGRTILHHAAAGGRDELAELLLKSGAEPNAVDARGRTPLMLAAASKAGSGRLESLLLKYGADPNRRTAP